MRPFRRSRLSAAKFFAHIVALAAAESDDETLPAPFVSLIVPVYNTAPAYLDALVASVRAQKKGAWELVLSDDGSTAPETRDWLDRQQGAADLRILRHAQNRGIAAASNAAIEAALTPWIGFLDHDDALAPYALEQIWRALPARPECQFLYTDEVVATGKMRPVDLFLKPAFDPVLLSGVNYLNHLSLYRRERVIELGGLREGYEGSQDYDLVLRYTRELKADECVHLPYPAYIWRRDGASYSAKNMGRATDNARRALAEAYASDFAAPVVEAAVGGDLHRVRFDAARRHWPLVSVVIPNRDSPALISNVVQGLKEKTD
ncbi:MAG TPA: glycosyltransferase [Roseiarcus sp.]|nr:glycosyltransferase [Roseiarcus sp.]